LISCEKIRFCLPQIIDGTRNFDYSLHMNITELARRLRVPTEELRAKLPELGFDIGSKAIKVPDRDVGRIMQAWQEFKKRSYLEKKMLDQKARAERRAAVHEGRAEVASLPPIMTVREFAEILNLPIARVMQELMRSGILASLNERIDFETASIIAEDLGFRAEKKEQGTTSEEDVGISRLAEARNAEGAELQVPRAPVVVVMGHVDHGKTMLLDAIRHENVVATEAGGITQHIGAYQVVRNDRALTFIDTPGHEAFTVMRSRGAKVADIAILVVAVDDGVQPQTKEAIDIIKAAQIPFLVALNKIDKEGANIEKVKSQLSELGLIGEEWGGKTIMVPISAKKQMNIDQLLDMLLLVADMEKDHIVANPNRHAIGTVIESHIDKGQGPIATVLIQTGTLHLGDTMGLRNLNYGKVRAMRTWHGETVKEALPSMPVVILGFKDAPSVGDVMEVPEDAKTLEKLKEQPSRKTGAGEITVASKAKTDAVVEEGDEKVMLNIILKADVLGSLEALIGMIEKVQNPYVGVKIVSKGLGNITDSDILQADATHAFVAAFGVKPMAAAAQLAREKGVEIHEYSIIYRLFEDILERLKILIPAERVYTELGTVEIFGVFKKLPKGMVVGGKVKRGSVELGATARVLREGHVIGEGKIESLQSGKSNTRVVEQGADCGMGFTGKTKIEIGDILELYKEEMQERKLDINN